MIYICQSQMLNNRTIKYTKGIKVYERNKKGRLNLKGGTLKGLQDRLKGRAEKQLA